MVIIQFWLPLVFVAGRLSRWIYVEGVTGQYAPSPGPFRRCRSPDGGPSDLPPSSTDSLITNWPMLHSRLDFTVSMAESDTWGPPPCGNKWNCSRCSWWVCVWAVAGGGGGGYCVLVRACGWSRRDSSTGTSVVLTALQPQFFGSVKEVGLICQPLEPWPGDSTPCARLLQVWMLYCDLQLLSHVPLKMLTRVWCVCLAGVYSEVAGLLCLL